MDSDKTAPEKRKDSKKYKIYFELAAQKEFADLDHAVREAFADPVKRMKEHPTQDATHLRNVKSKLPLYKKRIGDYRVFLSIDSRNRQIVVLAIRKRDSDTYEPGGLESIAARYSGPHDKQPDKRSKRKGQ
ncbi:MAG: type II toxin-antitoxin system RelE/ParE family toxin [Candidatus Obscuribacterales bacterium]|nr:type II toxin-antitoxin system RelE/ParE family toxin [Candidatus Obscuribacterales bacterium]